ncbi:MAG: hypothetical protein GY926_19000, partial [bacterium]|nr:hypothetical protein [bacterium]
EIMGSELFLKANVGLDHDVQAELNVTVQVYDPSLGTGVDDSDALTIQILALGDMNGDGMINTVDISLFQRVFFTTDPTGDFNNDGIVNTVDLSIFMRAFHEVASSATSTSSQTSTPPAASASTLASQAQTVADPGISDSSAGSSVENSITPSQTIERPAVFGQSARVS